MFKLGALAFSKRGLDLAFIDQIKSLLGLKEAGKDDNAVSFDKKLAAAALMVHVIAADGIITRDEEDRLSAVLKEHYTVSDAEAETLFNAAKLAQKRRRRYLSIHQHLKERNGRKRTPGAGRRPVGNGLRRRRSARV